MSLSFILAMKSVRLKREKRDSYRQHETCLRYQRLPRREKFTDVVGDEIKILPSSKDRQVADDGSCKKTFSQRRSPHTCNDECHHIVKSNRRKHDNHKARLAPSVEEQTRQQKPAVLQPPAERQNVVCQQDNRQEQEQELYAAEQHAPYFLAFMRPQLMPIPWRLLCFCRTRLCSRFRPLCQHIQEAGKCQAVPGRKSTIPDSRNAHLVRGISF